MTSRIFVMAALAFVAIGCVPSSTSQQSDSIPEATPSMDSEPLPDLTKVFDMKTSGYRFPPQVGDFTMVNVRQYDETGNDVSVGYNDFKAGVALTLYVYAKLPQRPNTTLKDHFAYCQSEVVAKNPGAKLLGETKQVAKIAGAPKNAFRALYAIDNGTKHSEVFVTEDRTWYVLIRSTYLTSSAASGSAAVGTFMADYPWPSTMR